MNQTSTSPLPDIGVGTLRPRVQRVGIAEALRSARDTRAVEMDRGAIARTPQVFSNLFGAQDAIIVADVNTFRAAGAAVAERLRANGVSMRDPLVFADPDLYAETRFVERVENRLREIKAIPVAVGSGTINDLTKLAAHRVERSYLSVATAASMDGYTAYGASITHEGSKQTFFCPAPAGVVVDLDIIAQAPGLMNSWGYADFVAKVTAGADWILADALGAEPIDAQAWTIVQGRLRELLAEPAAVRARDPEALGRLMEGLILGGFAMQSAQSSRPASGAEHQFSHLWDMQHHKHEGRTPSHGFKVGIGTLAVASLYEFLLEQDFTGLDVDACCAAWPDRDTQIAEARRLLEDPALAEISAAEVAAKYVSRERLREQLCRLRDEWPELKVRLREQLGPPGECRHMLEAVGAPVEPEQIGISRERLGRSFHQAACIRRRFTVLDVAARTGLLAKFRVES